MANNVNKSLILKKLWIGNFERQTGESKCQNLRPVAPLESVQSCFQISPHFFVTYRNKTQKQKILIVGKKQD